MDYSIFSHFRHFKVFAGYSGGADSTALLLLAARGAQHFDFELTAVHFNHHLRGEESDREAVEAAEFAARLGVKFLLIDLDIAPGGNLEARARQARLEKFRELAGDDPRAVVLLGHHADDRVENMFLRLFRGSNVSALAGLRQECTIGGVRFFRPLAACRRREIEDFLRENGIENWAHDSSNECDFYARNFLRNRLLPAVAEKFPHAPDALLVTLENLQCDAEFIESTARKTAAENDLYQRRFWQELHPALLVRCLRLFLDENFGEDLPVSRDSVERFRTMLAQGGRGRLEFDERRVLILDEKSVMPLQTPVAARRWQWRENAQADWGNWRFRVELLPEMPPDIPLDMACFDAASFPEKLVIDTALPGDRMVPFGRKQAVKVKELRIKRGIPAYPPLPVLRDEAGNILWLPAVRHSGLYTCRPGGEILAVFVEKM